jgi:hypothetical protein
MKQHILCRVFGHRWKFIANDGRMFRYCTRCFIIKTEEEQPYV